MDANGRGVHGAALYCLGYERTLAFSFHYLLLRTSTLLLFSCFSNSMYDTSMFLQTATPFLWLPSYVDDRNSLDLALLRHVNIEDLFHVLALS